MSPHPGAGERASSLLDDLRDHARSQLRAGLSRDVVFRSLQDRARGWLPSLADGDNRQIAEFILEEMSGAPIRPAAGRSSGEGCRIIPFPGPRQNRSEQVRRKSIPHSWIREQDHDPCSTSDP